MKDDSKNIGKIRTAVVYCTKAKELKPDIEKDNK